MMVLNPLSRIKRPSFRPPTKLPPGLLKATQVPSGKPLVKLVNWAGVSGSIWPTARTTDWQWGVNPSMHFSCFSNVIAPATLPKQVRSRVRMKKKERDLRWGRGVKHAVLANAMAAPLAQDLNLQFRLSQPLQPCIYCKKHTARDDFSHPTYRK